MVNLLSLLATKTGRLIASIVGALLTAIGFAFYFIGIGKRKAEQKQQQQSLDNLRERDLIDDQISGNSDTDNRDRLRDWQSD